MKFRALVHEDEDGSYWAEVDELPGSVTQGDNAEELTANLKEVIEMYLEGFIEDYQESASKVEPGPPPDETWEFQVHLSRAEAPAKN